MARNFKKFASINICSYLVRPPKMSLFTNLNRLVFNISNLNISQFCFKKTLIHRTSALRQNALFPPANKIHTSGTKLDLMEFFDEPENWSKKQVKVGRAWKVEELRLKSNSDLHKLWYVLLKERNMLMTMMHEFKRKNIGFPNPERLDKVEISMENLERVVKERDRAYFELETGETGERPVGNEVNCFGLPYQYKMKEHLVEKRVNKKFLEQQKLFNQTDDHAHVREFLVKLNEKRQRMARWKQRNLYVMVCELLKRFPNVDEEALKAQFPDVDIDRAKKDERSRGHRQNLY